VSPKNTEEVPDPGVRPAEITPARVGLFIGVFNHALDSKKRLTIPLEWRGQVGEPESLFVAPIHGQCLYALAAREMIRRLNVNRGHSVTDPDLAAADRILGSQAELIAWDSQGRIRLRDDLLTHAQLADQVVLVGAFDRIELWNPRAWEKHRASEEGEPGDAARRLGF